jgi:hypothetical protein
MTHKIIDWETFLRKIMSFSGKDMERVSGTEVHRGPVESVTYDSEGHLSIRLHWLARLGTHKENWVVLEAKKTDIRLLMLGFRIIEWSDGRVSLDDESNPLSTTYTFLTKEPQLKCVKSY